jgi:hypothetical protein
MGEECYPPCNIPDIKGMHNINEMLEMAKYNNITRTITTITLK